MINMKLCDRCRQICKFLKRPRMPSIENHDNFCAFGMEKQMEKKIADRQKYNAIYRKIAGC